MWKTVDDFFFEDSFLLLVAAFVLSLSFSFFFLPLCNISLSSRFKVGKIWGIAWESGIVGIFEFNDDVECVLAAFDPGLVIIFGFTKICERWLFPSKIFSSESDVNANKVEITVSGGSWRLLEVKSSISRL